MSNTDTQDVRDIQRTINCSERAVGFIVNVAGTPGVDVRASVLSIRSNTQDEEMLDLTAALGECAEILFNAMQERDLFAKLNPALKTSAELVAKSEPRGTGRKLEWNRMCKKAAGKALGAWQDKPDTTSAKYIKALGVQIHQDDAVEQQSYGPVGQLG